MSFQNKCNRLEIQFWMILDHPEKNGQKVAEMSFHCQRAWLERPKCT